MVDSKQEMIYDELDHMQRVLSDVGTERAYQINKWGGYGTDDAENMPNDFVSYIARYSTMWFSGGFPPYNAETIEKFRKGMVKVAALAVSAVQWADRRIEEGLD